MAYAQAPQISPDGAGDAELVRRARAALRENVEKKIGPVVMEAFPFAGKRCERLTEAVLRRLGLPA